MTLESRLVNLAATAHKLVELGLLHRTSGSVSLRWLEFCYISPAGARLDRLSAADFIALDIGGHNTWQVQRASSAYALHLACYRMHPDAATVLLLQPVHCIALGCAGLSMPAITPEFYLAFGAEVPLLTYSASTSPQLVEGVSALIAEHEAVLLQNQGLVLVAPTTDEAFAKSLLLEETARIIVLARAATGACSSLTTEQMEELGPLRRGHAASSL